MEMLLTVRVKPGARESGVEEKDGETIVRVRERAIEGAANEAVVRVLAEHFKVAPGRVRLVRGAAARVKRFSIDLP
ncbi:MAG TPA: DUF167 domain-containing protein [Candidatus Baltobacteraceae bacterium]|nr:DUF167 domain-containing protein [Candidatus Baltobacteraceae bacterium]